MTHEEIMEKVQRIFRDVFDDESLIITGTTNSSDIEDWDSLEHIALVVSMEKEVNELANVGEMVALIASKL